jgi:hypothetical protein
MNFMQQKLTLAGMTGAVTTSSASSSSSGSMGHFMAKKKANSLITKKQGGKPLKPLKKMDSSSLLEAIAAGPPAMRTPHYGGFALHQSRIKDTRALKPLEEREQPLTDEGHESRKQDKEAQVEFPQNIQQQESSDLGRKNSSTIQDDDISQFGGSAFDSSVDFDSQQLLSREIHWLQQALVSKTHTNASKLVGGAQFRMASHSSASCESCGAAGIVVKKLKESLRQCRNALKRAEAKLQEFKDMEAYRNANIAKGMIDNMMYHKDTKSTGKKMDEDAVVDATKQTYAEDKLKNEVSDLRQRLANKSRECKMAREDSELEKKHRRDMEKRVVEGREKLDAQAEAMSEAKRLTREYREKATQLDDELRILREKTRKARDREDLERKVELESMEKKCEERISVHIQARQDAEDALLVERDARKEENRQRDARDASIARKIQVNDDELREKISVLQMELQKVSTASKVRGDVEVEWTKKTRLLMEQLEYAEGVAERLSAARKSDEELSARAIEKALTNALQLCVVAPVVNIHVHDKKLNIKGAISEESVRQAVAKDILQPYTFLFAQNLKRTQEPSGLGSGTSNSEGRNNVQTQPLYGPDGTTKLDVWTEKMLGKVQKAIQSHLTSAWGVKNTDK